MENSQPTETEETPVPAPADATKIQRLRREARRWQSVTRFIMLFYAVCWGTTLVALLLSEYWRIEPLPHLMNFLLVLPVCLSPFFFASTASWRKSLEKCQSQIDLQAIGLIIEGLPVGDTRGFSMAILMGLMPRLKSSDGHLLEARHHRILNRLLSGNRFYEASTRNPLIITILKAYEQIGNKEDLPTVERLANGEGYAKRDREIREAAEGCLPYLQARSEQAEARQTLLRASSETGENSANLLRPAHGGNGTEPSQLLRASNAETAE